MQVYVDGSALARAILELTESVFWLEWLSSSGSQLVASEVSVTEFRKSVQLEGPDKRTECEEYLDRLEIVPFSDEVLLTAATMSNLLPPFIAIHIATAQSREGVDSIATYDQELATASAHFGFEVISPGLPENWWELEGQGLRRVASKLAVVAKVASEEERAKAKAKRPAAAVPPSPRDPIASATSRPARAHSPYAAPARVAPSR